MRNKFLIFIGIALFTFACTSTIETVDESLERTFLQLSDPKPLHLENVNWYIIEEENVKYIGVKLKDYKKLALNMEKIQGFIQLQKKLNQQYRDYYEPGARSGSQD